MKVLRLLTLTLAIACNAGSATAPRYCGEQPDSSALRTPAGDTVGYLHFSGPKLCKR